MEEKKPVYLIFVDPAFGDQGHNKYYNMTPLGDGTFKSEYGRVGAGSQVKIYPMSKWNSTYNSKIKKGYTDISDSMQDVIEDSKVEFNTDEEEQFTLVKNPSVRDIIRRLWDYANKTIQSAYKVSSNVVTQAMVDNAQEILDTLSNGYKNMSVEEFNEKLVSLFITIPRKMRKVSDHLADTKEQFESIIAEEQSILDTMAGQVYKPTLKRLSFFKEDEDSTKESILQQMGIEMEDASEEDVSKIKKAMGDQAGKFYKAWRVTNCETQVKFETYTEENHIGNVKLLCHGSRNQNWFNILKTGLKIRPAGVIAQGNLFGLGCYWSNPEKEHGGVAKSIGYTSLSGSYWTSGRDSSGFIAFFDVAIGESYDVYSFGSQYYDFNLQKLHQVNPNAWSLWAHGQGSRNNGSTLINDEIIVYNEQQCTIKYLVEIR